MKIKVEKAFSIIRKVFLMYIYTYVYFITKIFKLKILRRWVTNTNHIELSDIILLLEFKYEGINRYVEVGN